jgi:NTE family protein
MASWPTAIGRRVFDRPPKIGLVLGSGSTRGWAHVGAIHALEEEGIQIDVVTGASVGAIAGAFLAARAMEKLAEFATEHTSLWHTLTYVDPTLTGPGLLSGRKFNDLLERKFPVRDFSELKIRLGVVATNITDMEEIHLFEGPLIPALRASVALPLIFPPVEMDGLQLVDGGVLNPIPVNLARKLGADFVIAVDLNSSEEPVRATSSTGVLDRSISTMLRRIRSQNLRLDPPDVLIEPRLSSFGRLDYHRADEGIGEGYRAAREKMPEIRRKLKSPVATTETGLLRLAHSIRDRL